MVGYFRFKRAPDTTDVTSSSVVSARRNVSYDDRVRRDAVRRLFRFRRRRVELFNQLSADHFHRQTRTRALLVDRFVGVSTVPRRVFRFGPDRRDTRRVPFRRRPVLGDSPSTAAVVVAGRGVFQLVRPRTVSLANRKFAYLAGIPGRFAADGRRAAVVRHDGLFRLAAADDAAAAAGPHDRGGGRVAHDERSVGRRRRRDRPYGARVAVGGHDAFERRRVRVLGAPDRRVRDARLLDRRLRGGPRLVVDRLHHGGVHVAVPVHGGHGLDALPGDGRGDGRRAQRLGDRRRGHRLRAVSGHDALDQRLLGRLRRRAAALAARVGRLFAGHLAAEHLFRRRLRGGRTFAFGNRFRFTYLGLFRSTFFRRVLGFLRRFEHFRFLFLVTIMFEIKKKIIIKNN